VRNFLWDYSTDLYAIPVTSAGAVKGDWVTLGQIKGVAIGDADPDTDIVIVQIKGGVNTMFLSATGVDITEGTPLLFDAALDTANGGFTNVGATASNYDAIAGLGTDITAAATGTGRVWIGLLPANMGGAPTVSSLTVSGGAAGAHTVTGILATSTLITVLDNNAGTIADLTSEFTVTAADTIDNTGGTASTQLMVFWQDLL